MAGFEAYMQRKTRNDPPKPPGWKEGSALIHAKGRVTSASNKAKAISNGLEQGIEGQAGRVAKSQALTGTLHLPKKPVTVNTGRLTGD